MPNTPERVAAGDALNAAHQALLEHLWALQRTEGDWTDAMVRDEELASALVDVADYGRRVLLGDSNLYQAEKAGHLLVAAQRIVDVLAESIGWPA